MLSHRVERLLPCSPELLFDLAADVERYPEFLPWWIEARVTRREGDHYWTDQTIAFGPLRTRFGSQTDLCRPDRIDVNSQAAPFRQFHLSWSFEPLPDRTTQVSLTAQLDLRSRLLERIVAPILKGIITEIITAFEARALLQSAGNSAST